MHTVHIMLQNILFYEINYSDSFYINTITVQNTHNITVWFRRLMWKVTSFKREEQAN